MDDGITAAMRYKEIVGLARASAENLRDWEIGRADELEARLAEAHQAVADAAEREQRAVDRCTRWWKMAQHNVEGLSWLPDDEAPTPVPTARPGYLEKYLEEVKPSYQELVQAVLSLGWRAKRS
ncbi:hypothetical protein DMH01_25255 [Amycolatopsis sp. WAC 04182]|uniref:hypothetical protein n=1 Tax=Amycolatopsis sp. WAC 04182 TaxID=2203198 RepID=UPI000F7926FD|nr:hypothetical protein [Amycolatopsis sp. WAC 04182]RSN59276.1 hypothetical protein DMH01_25255 [Amycolatopsis sp. WAC 04182]